MSALRAKRNGATVRRVGENETHVRVVAEGGYESRMSRLDLLESQATSFFHQVDESEIAGPEHDDRLVTDALLAWLGVRRGPGAPRFLQREPHRGVVLVASEERLNRPLVDRAANEVVQPIPVALLERRALRLPVVGEDDDFVRARGVAGRPLDAA